MKRPFDGGTGHHHSTPPHPKPIVPQMKRKLQCSDVIWLLSHLRPYAHVDGLLCDGSNLGRWAHNCRDDYFWAKTNSPAERLVSLNFDRLVLNSSYLYAPPSVVIFASLRTGRNSHFNHFMTFLCVNGPFAVTPWLEKNQTVSDSFLIH